MKATCPTNSEHKEFGTTAHVMQDWKVDEKGKFLNVISDCLQVTVDPHIDNVWTCITCGAEATVTE